jgi:hypothetical protein
MPKRPPSRKLNHRALRDALAARAKRLHSSASRAFPAASAGLSTAIRELGVPAPTHTAGAPLPLVEPIWSFWLDAAHLARLTTLLAARQIEAHMTGSSRIPKLNLPPPLIALLKTWFDDHRNGDRASARAANYVAHYGLHLPGDRGRPSVTSSRFLDAFHTVLLEAVRHKTASLRTSQPDADYLVLLLRRLHLNLAQTASLVVEGVPTPDLFTRLGMSLSLGRADLLTAQWLLARPELTAALRGAILVPYAEAWAPPLDQLRHLTGTADSLTFFYYELATTAEALLLSIRFANWPQSTSSAATNWANFWQPEILRYLVAYQEVTGIPLTEASAKDRATQPADAIERR